jgi:sugar phosphate permease
MRPGPEYLPFRARVLASTWMAYAGFYFCRKAFYVVKSDVGEALDLTTGDLGDLGMGYLIAYTLGQFMSAGIGPRFGPKLLLLVGMALSIICNIAFGFANNYWTLFVFLALNGFAQATGWPSVIGALAQWTVRSERGWLLGLWGTCYQLGGVMANAWAAWWLARSGWRGSFFAASVVLMIVWVVVALLLKNKPEDVGLPPLEDYPEEKIGEGVATHKHEESGWTREVITTVVLVGCFYFGVKFVRYALWSWAPYFLKQNYGLAGDDAGYMSTIFDLAGFAGVIFAGLLSDKVFHSKRAKVAFLMLLGMLGGTALMAMVGGLNLTWFAISLGVTGFMLFGPDSLLTGAGAIDVGSKKVAIRAAGIINGMGSIGSVVQETVIARVYESNEGRVGPVFVTLFGAAALSVVCLSVVLVRNKQGKSDL